MDYQRLLAFAVDTAGKAGEILRANYGFKQKISFKGEIDLVTEIDKKSEEFILGRIREVFPDHGVLSEESPELSSSSQYRWIIDPLDGTTNYAHGYPCFCVSICVELEGKQIAGAVYDPMRDEMYSAIAGAGAFLNGRRIAVSDTEELRKSLLATGFSYDVRHTEDNNLDYFKAFVFTAQAIRRDGSAALDLCYVAAGRFDGYWEMKLKPWDTAAGSLIVREAGGVVTRLDGGAYDLQHPGILASNGKIHTRMLEVLREAKK